jgi:cytochrome c biogenesis protein
MNLDTPQSTQTVHTVSQRDSTPKVSTAGILLNTRKMHLNQLVELLSSMRFSITLLMVVAAASVIGTVVEQNKPWVNYVNQFGAFWAEKLHSIGVFSVYNSPWFLLIMAFLVLSLSLCLIRNTPSMLREMHSFKDRMGRAGVLAHPHRGQSTQPVSIASAAQAVTAHLQQAGYRLSTKQRSSDPLSQADDELMIAAKKGTHNRWGYLLAHGGMVVILVGGLLDSELPLRAIAAIHGALPIHGNQLVSKTPAVSRLPAGNPSYRANVLIPEGASTQHAIVNYQDGVLIQPLPFELTLKKFNVEYYSTGMPKLFTSDVLVRDPDSGKTFEKRIIVNEPLTYKGVTIYQSSFDDGGSTVQFNAHPLFGASSDTFVVKGTVGESAVVSSSLTPTLYTVEFSAYRPINVEDFSKSAADKSASPLSKIMSDQDSALNSVMGVQAPRSKQLHNVGPSVVYKLRDSAGQAKEYQAYQLPVRLGDDGQLSDSAQPVLLLGMRDTISAPFKFMRIPADINNSAQDYMRFRAAMANPAIQAKAAKAFANRSTNALNRSPESVAQLQNSAAKALAVFAGKADGSAGGFTALATFIDRNVPKAQAETVANVILKVLSGTAWEVWQQARLDAGLPVLQGTQADNDFLQTALTAYNDSFFLGAPFILQLQDAQHKQASVFQVTKSPGKFVVYLGALLLVAGVFAMFYIRERRLWVWLRKVDDETSDITWALSAPKRGLAFDKEYSHWQNVLGRKAQKPDPNRVP